MLGFRLSAPGPFWFEDLVYIVVDEARRLPGRAAKAATYVHRMTEAAGRRLNAIRTPTVVPVAEAAPEPRARVHIEAELLDEPLAWTLATEPLTKGGAGAAKVVALHNAAGQQLGAVTYALDRLRDELAPMMAHVNLGRSEVLRLADTRLETSIEALLELSRTNAATRPKERTLTAA